METSVFVCCNYDAKMPIMRVIEDLRCRHKASHTSHIISFISLLLTFCCFINCSLTAFLFQQSDAVNRCNYTDLFQVVLMHVVLM